MINFSESVPNNNEVGKVWIKPSLGQAYMYLNGDWRPMIGGPVVATEYTYPLTFFIRGINRTEYIKNMGSVEKQDALTDKIDILKFRIWDKDRIVLPREGEEVMVFRKDTPDGEPYKWFGGTIDQLEPQEIAPGQHKFIYGVKCVDYGKRLNKKLVTETYENEYDDDIIDHVVENYANEFTTYNVERSQQIDEIVFDYKNAGEAIRNIAKRTNYEYYVDYEKDIHYLRLGSVAAPYSITENIETTGHYKDLKIDSDKSQLKNRIYARGGKYLSDEQPYEFVADGIQTTFNLPYLPRNPIHVYVDTGDGNGYDEKSLGVDDLSTTGDFVVNYESGTIKNLDYDTLNSGDKLKVTMKREIQALTQDDDEASINAIQEIEGGDGIYEHLESVPEIKTIDGCHEAALAILAVDKDIKVLGSFQTEQDGYRSGQTIILDLPNWGYENSEHLIQRVISRLRSDGTSFMYTVYFTVKIKELTDLFTQIMEMSTSAFALQTLENETVHDLAVLVDVEAPLPLENNPTFEERDPNWTYGPDANEGVYNEASYR